MWMADLPLRAYSTFLIKWETILLKNSNKFWKTSPFLRIPILSRKSCKPDQKSTIWVRRPHFRKFSTFSTISAEMSVKLTKYVSENWFSREFESPFSSRSWKITSSEESVPISANPHFIAKKLQVKNCSDPHFSEFPFYQEGTVLWWRILLLGRAWL